MGVVSAVISYINGSDKAWVNEAWANSDGAIYLGIFAYVAIIAYFIWHSRRAKIDE